jgi:hypothetical protein
MTQARVAPLASDPIMLAGLSVLPEAGTTKRMYAPIVVVVEKYVGKNFRDLTACGVVTLLPHEALDSVGDVVLMVAQDGQEVSLDPYHVLTKAENSLIFDAC